MRRAGAGDEAFLAQMVWLAHRWRDSSPPPASNVLPDDLARYVTGFGREGDGGIVADGLGAAWYRLLHGYGFVADDKPELSLAVVPAARGRGVGSALLDAACDLARGEGRRALSLSVERDNAARGLYARAGFQEIAETPGALTMLREL